MKPAAAAEVFVGMNSAQAESRHNYSSTVQLVMSTQ